MAKNKLLATEPAGDAALLNGQPVKEKHESIWKDVFAGIVSNKASLVSGIFILILAASRLTFGFQDTDYLKRCFIDTQSFANSIAFGEQIIDNRLSDNTNSGSAAEITFSHITAFS